MPFLLLGIDSDSGGEFINDVLLRFTQENEVEFTRSRPYRKNDQAWVEQKTVPWFLMGLVGGVGILVAVTLVDAALTFLGV